MARRREAPEGVYVEKPKADIYLALLIVTTVATSLATFLMAVEAGFLGGR